ncbi:putative Long chain acyl-CoA synthetase 4 [Nannochloris sp. 'desiccata']|nr:putative Long chain acyl-CoA synthetase 4 [Chlorella desiccata (nom. nud.)]
MGELRSYIVEVGPPKPAANGKPATGPEYRAVIAKDGPPTLAGITTLYEAFSASVVKYPTNNCLGHRTADGSYSWLTYQETAERAAAIASAMASVGVGPHDRAGVYGANCPEWMISMQACNRMTIYCVPLYDSLGENAIEYIINHSESSIVFAQSEKLGMLAKALPHVKDQIKHIVYWGAADAASIDVAKGLGMAVYSFDEFLALGRSKPVAAVPPAAKDLCTIMYTSGTTGDPKGVELTHSGVLGAIISMKNFTDSVGVNFDENEVYLSFLPLAHIFDRWGALLSHGAVIATIASQRTFEFSVPKGGITPDDCYLSYLPLAHIFDRTAEELMLHLGASIGYWRGDIKGLVDDIGALRPTLFCGVPRVFDRIYGGVMAKVDGGSGLKKALFHWGYKRKLHALDAGHAYDKAAPFFDKLVFSKIKERLGGRVRLIVSGGAPLARHVEDFLRVTMCCRVVQGYGLTETCAASFIAVPDVAEHAGTVGPPQPVLSMRLEAVPEMNYDPMAVPPRGEVCVKGPAVFTGYYKADDKTTEVLESDGWFHTGDIGELTPSGALRIIDRKKNIFKLSQGEYIAVEKVEGIYSREAAVEQIFVYGNSFESSLVAVVVPNVEAIRSWSSAGAGATAAQLCADPAVKAKMLETMTATAKEGKLKGFEQVRAVYLEPELFAVENELLTPTFKLKRPQLQKKYQAEIDAMYAAMKTNTR